MFYKKIKINSPFINNKYSSILLGFLIFSCIFIATGCKQIDVFEKNTTIPNKEWKASFGAKGNFEIKDTLAFYELYVVLRHTDAYKYNNIWLNVGLQSPGDSMYFQKVNLSLGNDADGWFGSGMNDIWEVRKRLTDKPMRFKKAGTYNFSIFQIMRDNPLAEIMSAGLRVTKANVTSVNEN